MKQAEKVYGEWREEAFIPAPIFPFSYGYQGFKVGSLQAVLQQLFSCINILRDALHTLMQHPWALADLALGGMQETEEDGMSSEEMMG